MEWTPEQNKAIGAVIGWLAEQDTMLCPSDPVFRLFGFAGTGKTTIAKAIADAVDGQVIFAAFTGKAALVLNSKECWGARTIHSLIYTPKEKCASRLAHIREKMELETDADRHRELQAEYALEHENLKRPAFTLNLNSDLREAALLILDEVSMVDSTIGPDLESFRVPILALGDPAQLSPVRGCGYFTNQTPDFMLTEIHRQAEGSGILSMATAVRQGRPLAYRDDEDARVIPRGMLKAADLAEFDQVICGMNKTRRTINRHIRQVKGFNTPLPEPGDRIICLRNDNDSGLLNGSQWDVHSVCENIEDVDWIDLEISAAGDGGYKFEVTAHKQYFLGTEDEIPHYNVRSAQCFDFAYAVTCHKAQGDEWDDVVIINESYIFKGQAPRWLYTAVTRAAKRVTVIQ